MGQNELKESLNLQYNTNIAKNVIIFIGDGMGISTVSAARIFNRQIRRKTFEDAAMAWEKFPHCSLSKVRTQKLHHIFMVL